MGTIGKLVHYSVDAVLLSALIAGVRRSTGLTFNSEELDSQDIRGLVNKYLGVGEWMLDTSAAFLQGSNYFEKKGRDSK